MRQLIIVFIMILGVFVKAQSQEKLGRQCIYNLYAKKDFKKVSSYFSESLKKSITEKDMENIDSQIIQKFGDYQEIIEVSQDEEGRYHYHVRFENTSLYVIVGFDNENKIKVLLMSPEDQRKGLKKK